MITKWKKLNVAARASIVYLIVSIIHTGISFFASPIYTRILSETEYGSVSVFLSYQTLIGVVAMYCLSYGFFDNAMHANPLDRDKLSFSILCLSNITTALTFIPCFILKHFFSGFFTIEWNVLIVMFIVFLLQPAYNLWASRQRYEYKYKASAIITLITSLASPLVAILFIHFGFFSDNVLNRVLGSYIPFLFLYVFLYVYLAKKANFKIDVKYWKSALKFNTPLIPHYLSLYILSSSDKLIIENMISKNAVAFYSIAATIASIGTLVWSAINSSLIPFIYKKCDTSDFKGINKTISPLLLLNFLFCLAVILFAPEVLRILAPESYNMALFCIPPLLGGVFFTSLYHTFSDIIYYYEKTGYVMIASVVSALLNIVLNILFIQLFGFVAAAYTTLFCYFVQALLLFLFMKKCAKNSVFNIKFIVFVSAIAILFSICSQFLYFDWTIRFAFIEVLSIGLIIFRKKALSLLKAIRNG